MAAQRPGLTQALGAMKTFVAALVALLASGNAIACSCKSFTLSQAKEASDIVFVGQVSMLQCSSTPGKTAVNFNVSSAFKGRPAQETVVLIESNSASCGYVTPFFFPGFTYLIFGYQDGAGLETSRCLPNKRGGASPEEARALKAGT